MAVWVVVMEKRVWGCGGTANMGPNHLKPSRGWRCRVGAMWVSHWDRRALSVLSRGETVAGLMKVSSLDSATAPQFV